MTTSVKISSLKKELCSFAGHHLNVAGRARLSDILVKTNFGGQVPGPLGFGQSIKSTPRAWGGVTGVEGSHAARPRRTTLRGEPEDSGASGGPPRSATCRHPTSGRSSAGPPGACELWEARFPVRTRSRGSLGTSAARRLLLLSPASHSAPGQLSLPCRACEAWLGSGAAGGAGATQAGVSVCVPCRNAHKRARGPGGGAGCRRPGQALGAAVEGGRRAAVDRPSAQESPRPEIAAPGRSWPRQRPGACQ